MPDSKEERKPLPKPDPECRIVDWDSETVQDLNEEGMYDEMVDMAAGEFKNHMRDLTRMKDESEEKWKAWPPWKVAHSVKGLCLSLSFVRLARYAQNIEKLKEDIAQEDLGEIIENMEKLFELSLEQAKRGGEDDDGGDGK